LNKKIRKEKEMLPGGIVRYNRLRIKRSRRRNFDRKLVMFMHCTVSLSYQEQYAVAYCTTVCDCAGRSWQWRWFS
jgi:hypothetical protein